MENNWEEKVKKIINNYPGVACNLNSAQDVNMIITISLDAMNLVFEATKKECSEKARLCWKNESHPKGYPYFAWNPNGKKEQGDLAIHVDRESILNINKPNL